MPQAVTRFRDYARRAVKDLSIPLPPSAIGTTPLAAGGLMGGIALRPPVGVVACIAAYNFPLVNMAGKVAPALAAGNTVVMKPAPQDPLMIIELARIFAEVGFPPGVVNLVTSSRPEPAAVLTESPDVDCVSFTGSTAIGTRIYEAGARTMKRMLLELGGKGAALVLADADVDKAVAALVSVWGFHSGQICTAPTRAIVHRSLYDELVSKLAATAPLLQVGDADRPEDGRRTGHLRRAPRAGGELHQQRPGRAYFQTGGLVDAILNLGMPAPMDIQVSGSDIRQAHKIAMQIAGQVRALPGVSDVLVPQDVDFPALKVEIDRGRASELGLNEKEVVGNVITALTSDMMIAPSYWVDPKSGNNYMLTVQYPENYVKNLTDLGAIPLRGTGAWIRPALGIADVSRIDIEEQDNRRAHTGADHNAEQYVVLGEQPKCHRATDGRGDEHARTAHIRFSQERS